MSDATETTTGSTHWRMRSARLTRILLIPVIGLYLYLLYDLTPPGTEDERIIAFMFYMILGMLLIGAIGVRLRPVGMMILCLLAALLQTFSMLLILVMGWGRSDAITFVSAVLIMSLLFVAWQFRSDARAGRS